MKTCVFLLSAGIALGATGKGSSIGILCRFSIRRTTSRKISLTRCSHHEFLFFLGSVCFLTCVGGWTLFSVGCVCVHDLRKQPAAASMIGLVHFFAWTLQREPSRVRWQGSRERKRDDGESKATQEKNM